jgi:hypothetical protein
MNLAVEWVSCQITPSGKGRAEQLGSLRKKICQHKKSLTHKHAVQILDDAENKRIETSFEKMRADDEELTSKAFRTAYYLAKNDRPLNDYQGLLELQEINGADIGSGLRSRYSATEIVTHISQQMKLKACKKIKETGGCISILVDEATTEGNKSVLIVYLKCTAVASGDPHFMLLDLIELNDQLADTIIAALLDCLAKHGFDDAYLREHLVAFASDGASVMTGRKSGVATQLAKKYPSIITWHCLNHRLELAVGDAIDETQGTNHFRSFMDALYTLYSRSPKTSRKLETEAHELDIQIKKIGRVLNTRWVASSFRTVAAVWNNFEALANHFTAASDPTSEQFQQELKSKYCGLLRKLCSPQFVLDLGLMYDCLEELKFLSESLQRRDMNLPEADKLIRRSVRRIEHFKEKPGTQMTKAHSLAEACLFGNTRLKSNVKHVSINRNQLLQSLANSLRQRLLIADIAPVNANERPKTQQMLPPEERQDKQIIAQLSVIFPEYWPSEMATNYGEDELRLLCNRFRLPYASIRDAYGDYKDSGGRHMPKSFSSLMRPVNTIPVSTAECERGFSAMNIIITERRSSLLTEHVSSLMFIKLHGPPLEYWKPGHYVKSWLANHRSATDTRTRISVPTHVAEMKRPDPLWGIL